MKGYCLLATPRSGSTLIHTILSEYLRRTHGVTGLYEVFNLRQRLRVVDERLASGVFKGTVEPPVALYETIVDLRMRILDEAPGAYFFTVHPGQLDNRRLSGWLFNNYNVVFCERRNLFEQYLSYLISLKTERWNEAGGIRVAERSLDLTRQYAERIGVRLAEWYTVYRAFKTKAPTNPVIVYEEAVRDLNPQRVCRAAGFEGEVQFEGLRLPVKQNPEAEGKLRYFKDPASVVDGYRRTALQEWFSI